MRKASRFLLSHLTFRHNRTICFSNFSRYFVSEVTPVLPIKENPSPYSLTHFNSCNITRGLLVRKSKTRKFEKNSCQNLDTLIVKTSTEGKIKEISDIEEEFHSAVTTDEILRIFKVMESVLDDNDLKLGLACLKVGIHLEQEGKEPDKTLEFATRALNIFDKVDKESLSVAMTLHLMGSACYSLKRFNDSLGYLTRANSLLGKLELEGHSPDVIIPVLHAVHLELGNANMAMGRREDALINRRRCLEIKEIALGSNSREIGVAYRDLAETYVILLNFEEALLHCLKALEIHKAQLGDNSVEVARDRRLLKVIYTGLEEYQKALEQNEISQKILKNWGLSSDLVLAEVIAANMLISLRKYDEAINTLKGFVRKTDKESKNRALIFIAMAKALCNQNKFVNSKRLLEISCGILDKKKSEFPAEVAEAYMEVAKLYETMNEFETAITLLKKLLAILDKLPQEQHLEGSASAQIGWLLLQTGKVPQAIPYLEKAVGMLKESFGSKHLNVGHIYNNLGAAYLEMDRPRSAAQMFALAKDIMEGSFGPHHAESIEACQNLSKAYSAMGSYVIAMQFQQQVVDAWENHGSSALDEFKEAHRLLEQLKKKAGGSLSQGLSHCTSELMSSKS